MVEPLECTATDILNIAEHPTRLEQGAIVGQHLVDKGGRAVIERNRGDDIIEFLRVRIEGGWLVGRGRQQIEYRTRVEFDLGQARPQQWISGKALRQHGHKGRVDLADHKVIARVDQRRNPHGDRTGAGPHFQDAFWSRMARTFGRQSICRIGRGR